MDGLFKHITGSLIIYIISLLASITASAQMISKSNVVQLTAATDTFRNTHPVEKLYIQFDKPYYALGDTVWFKAYLFNAAFLMPSHNSGILYVELENDNKVIKRMMFPVVSGIAWGNIGLAINEFPEGSYTLRVYTNWMRNFGEDYIFKKSFYFANTKENDWLVGTRVRLSKDNGIVKANISLQFNQFNKEPVMLKDIQLEIYSTNKIWYKSKIQTKTDGSADINFNLKAPAKRLTMVAREINSGGESRKLIIPVSLDHPDNIDIQFMPEGGKLVAGLPACVGFKAIGEDGKAAATEGGVYNDRQELVASFISAHDGMGVFYMTPQADFHAP